MTAHPAVFSDSVLDVFEDLIEPDELVLDPFAGTGRIHEITDNAIGVEIEPEWASMHPRTICADALHLPFLNETFDVVATSPTYGNRMADHHEAKDNSKRITYRHVLGRPLHRNSSAKMQWGDQYRRFHWLAWEEARRVLVPGGRLILNVKDHPRNGMRIGVVQWHVQHLQNQGWEPLDRVEVLVPGMGFGANLKSRIREETVAVFRKPIEGNDE